MKTIKIFMMMTLSSALTGYSDWLSEDRAPKSTYDYYETKERVDAVVVPAYSYLCWGCDGERSDVLTEMGTNLSIAGSDGNYKTSFNMYRTQLGPDLDILDKMWENYYKGIDTANIGLKRTLDSELNESDRKQSYAEALFIRASLYFDLVQQFGRIPLVTEGSLEARTDFKRTSIEEVYRQIITDLRECTANLAPATKKKGRATSYAAAHLLTKVYLTRGSTVADKRRQKPTDMGDTLHRSEVVTKGGEEYQLVKDFADLWDISSMGNSEVIFTVQSINNSIFSGDGNTFHLCWLPVYDDRPDMQRNINCGRPYKRFRPSEKTLFGLFDRKSDSHFYKSSRQAFLSSSEKTIPVWKKLEDDGSVYFTPDPAKGQVEEKEKFALGNTAVHYTVERTGFKAQSLEMERLRAGRKYVYYPYEVQDLKHYPNLVKHMIPNRPSVAEKASSREWIRMRLGEAYLIAAGATGKKGNYGLTATYVNKARECTVWHEGEVRAPQFYTIEGGVNDTHSTHGAIKVTEAQLRSTGSVESMLGKRGRELLGKTCRWEDLVRTEKFYEQVKTFNPDTTGLKEFRKLHPIPQTHIDRLSPAGVITEEQNEGHYQDFPPRSV